VGYLEAGAALAFPAGPLVEVEPSDHGHLTTLGQVLAADGGQLVEGHDVDEVGTVRALPGDGEAEGGRLVLLSGVGLEVSGQAADQSDTVHGGSPSNVVRGGPGS
jgi:hypothetical protein